MSVSDLEPRSSSPISDHGVIPNLVESSATDMVTRPFPIFNHVNAIVQPFDTEAKRDDEFHQRLNAMLLELVIDFHAWSSARPAKEAERNADMLEREINGLLETEKEQGMCSTSELVSLLIGMPMSIHHRGLYICAFMLLTLYLLFIERTRQRLNDFVVRIKLALAALTGLASV
ncbi:hypothetical protein BXZ70DRAFT_110447 [Cristinia sonorae]|uniref:Uncharacterized protein n=1 Tax=Cristinia sonorae TaxID=1940300 RepID=A0A8K0URL8_9AGAR|nr:hypothetical protein BXZ70DRAFT_110447 [Cristinia sonorae]